MCCYSIKGYKWYRGSRGTQPRVLVAPAGQGGVGFSLESGQERCFLGCKLDFSREATGRTGGTGVARSVFSKG